MDQLLQHQQLDLYDGQSENPVQGPFVVVGDRIGHVGWSWCKVQQTKDEAATIRGAIILAKLSLYDPY